MRMGKRVYRKSHNSKSRSKSRSRSHSRRTHRAKHGGAAQAQAPAPYMGGAADYFQDYAQVGGAAAGPSFYDNYAAYADPRVAGGAYDMYYDAVDPRVAGAYADYAVDPRVAGAYADYAVDPRYGGAPLAPVDSYADWAQARYAGADGFNDFAPLIAAGETDLTAGSRAYNRRKPGAAKKAKKSVHVKASRKSHSKSRSRSRSRSRSHSRKHKAKHGGAVKTIKAAKPRASRAKAVAQPMMYDEPALVGGAYYGQDYAPLVGGYGYDYAPMIGGDAMAALTAGSKRKHNKSYAHKAYSRAKPGHTKKTVKVHAKGRARSRSSKH